MNRDEYREVYLRSEHWLKTREAALDRADHRCQVCNGAKSLDVHHRTYERLGHEEPGDLTVLCRKCHDVFHKGGRQVQKAKRPQKKRKGPKPLKPKQQPQFRKLTVENEKLHQRQMQAAANRAQVRAERRTRVSVDSDWMRGAA